MNTTVKPKYYYISLWFINTYVINYGILWCNRYLQEIGYTDTIIDVRSNRVRSLLGLNNNTETEENLTNTTGPVNGNEASNKRANENQGRQTPAKKVGITKTVFLCQILL